MDFFLVAGALMRQWDRPKGLYIHVPFCRHFCNYCDFFSLPVEQIDESKVTRIIEAIIKQAESLCERFNVHGFDTVFIGGGTPTALPEPVLRLLLAHVRRLAGAYAEWTIEANPEDLSDATINLIAESGITRLSVGVQSLDMGDLAVLGRRSTVENICPSIDRAAKAGLSVSADIITAIPAYNRKKPGRTGSAGTAMALIEAGVKHLSAYELIYEEGTKMYEQKNTLDVPSGDEIADEWDILEKALVGRGMHRYEVSNFCFPGNECAHNVIYWHLGSWLGAGPGAVSNILFSEAGRSDFDASLRIETEKSVESMTSKEYAIEPGMLLRETIMMGMRTKFGVDSGKLRNRFGYSMEELFPKTLGQWKDFLVTGKPWPKIITTSKGDSLAMNSKGMDILNAFLIQAEEEMEKNTRIDL